MLFRSDRKSTCLNSSHLVISYAVFCLKKKKKNKTTNQQENAQKYIRRQRGHLALNHLCSMVVLASCELCLFVSFFFFSFFFFNDTATTEIYTLSLHDALPI